MQPQFAHLENGSGANTSLKDVVELWTTVCGPHYAPHRAGTGVIITLSLSLLPISAAGPASSLPFQQAEWE